MTTKSLTEQLKHIKLLMKYAVPEEYSEEAMEFVQRFETDIIALNIFHAFYSYLPDAKDDAIRRFRIMARKQGTFLICAETIHAQYFYVTTSEQAEYLGSLSEGIWDQEVLDFFGYESRQTFLDKHHDTGKFPEYTPAYMNQALCPVCHTAEGELHFFGCPVEVCPWCGSQLTICNCRFETLGTNLLTGDQQLERLLEKLKEKGRVVFDPKNQNPTYIKDPGQLPEIE
ncbi:MAG: hypothetical protein KKE17_06385 [Proteobacteria bacterium]|nr:hypothetical protein [Pseudomonadota bacterium]